MCFRPPSFDDMMKTCEKCGAFNAPEATTCKKCGAELPTDGGAGMNAAPSGPKTPVAPKAPKTPGA